MLPVFNMPNFITLTFLSKDIKNSGPRIRHIKNWETRGGKNKTPQTLTDRKMLLDFKRHLHRVNVVDFDVDVVFRYVHTPHTTLGFDRLHTKKLG